MGTFREQTGALGYSKYDSRKKFNRRIRKCSSGNLKIDKSKAKQKKKMREKMGCGEKTTDD